MRTKYSQFPRSLRANSLDQASLAQLPGGECRQGRVPSFFKAHLNSIFGKAESMKWLGGGSSCTNPPIIHFLRFDTRSEEHTSELQSHSFISYAVFCLKKK